MDYCSSCRRHLNGALVCPGCGAYAPDIAPSATTAHREFAISGTWHDRPLDTGAEFHAGTDTATYAVAADVEGPSPAQQGRAARRRQLARWKKNKRRAVVASAVAFVGGGLTIATMDRHSPDRVQAAAAPDQRTMGTVEEQVPEQNPPASAPATTERTHRSSHTPSEPQSPTTSALQQQSLAAAAPRTPPPVARPDAAALPGPAALSTPQPGSTAPSTDDTAPERSDTTREQPSAPATADDRDSDASRTGPALISTSPTEVCVLVVCLG